MKKQVTTQDAFAPPASLSQAIRVGGLLFTSGCGPQDLRGNIQGDNVKEQALATIDNLEKILNAASATLADVCKVTVHLADLHRDFSDFEEAYKSRFSQPYPARTTVGSNLLGFLVEIDVVARTAD